MPSLRNILLFALPLAGSVLANNAPPSPSSTVDAFDAEQAWRDLLNALPEESLHAALHGSLPSFKDGIFESIQHGLDRVRQENAPLATRLIAAAVQDLKKRAGPAQTNNGTETPPSSTPTEGSSTPTSPPSSQAPPSSSEAPPASSSQAPPASSNNSPPPSSSQTPEVIVTTLVKTTNSEGKPTVVTSNIRSAAPTISVAVPITTTDKQGETITSQQTKPAIVVSTTDSAGNAVVTTSAVDLAPTVATTTDDKGSTFVTTFTPGGGVVSSLVLITTTGDDGKPSTMTSYTVIGGGGATGSNEQPAGTATTSVQPGLQTGVANKNSGKYWGVEAAVLGGIAAWLL